MPAAADLDEHLVGPRLRHRHLGDAQDVDPTVFVVLHSRMQAQPGGRSDMPVGGMPSNRLPGTTVTGERRFRGVRLLAEDVCDARVDPVLELEHSECAGSVGSSSQYDGTPIRS